jgi:NADP-dependent 3-hydroxy acid dehydrogenase YdfG
VLDSFEGRVAVITGGGSGIGRELALALCDLGMSLALVDIDQNCLVETAAVLSNPSAVRTYTADVGDREAIEKVAASVFRDLGTPSLLVSNAGLLGPLGKRVWEYANEEWKRVLSVNLYGGINVVRAFLPSMRELRWSSHVVIVASAAGVIPGNRMAPYFASKHAVELGARAAGRGIRRGRISRVPRWSTDKPQRRRPGSGQRQQPGLGVARTRGRGQADHRRGPGWPPLRLYPPELYRAPSSLPRTHPGRRGALSKPGKRNLDDFTAEGRCKGSGPI